MESLVALGETELEELESLLASPGWRNFLRYSQADWGPETYRRKVQQALGLVPDRPRAEDHVLQIEAAARAVERLLAWPEQRVRELRAKQESRPQALGRGGY